jgi:hypothetical protein
VNFKQVIVLFFEQWNNANDMASKITELEFKLEELGLGNLPKFDVSCAKARREANLWKLDLDPKLYEGAILQPTIHTRETVKTNLVAACG